ncbi:MULTISPECIES: hypothetical protein [unclassified Rhodanobacter]|uniref:hypothetical protein n=1 Tax=unclassified Rhodanobacter TaxID=2621553 RepID=UPI0009875ACA|nr:MULTISPECIES: hypothetical protein [unclassified Rhodanobacter]OOG51568.1 hypothetical protein B0E50_00355 [Rhodanobacter sp. C01]OOG58353.1 hypothetical protein B0E48_06055 [Rhodanobacter sp. C03]
MNTNAKPSFVLNDDDKAVLEAVLTQLDIFPESLFIPAPFSVSQLTSALNGSEPISLYQLLASAHFGFLPIPSSYRAFCNHAERINRFRPIWDALELLNDPLGRENEAAREFGFHNRDDLKQFYRALNELAESFGFDSFEAVWDSGNSATQGNDGTSPDEYRVYASGPAFLGEFAKRARAADMPDVTFGVHGDWVLYLHRDGDTVHAHPIDPVLLRHGGFEPHTPEFRELVPDEVIEALFELASTNYPGCLFDLVPPPIHMAIELITGDSK